MGLREKVTIILVIIALNQIACRHCMLSTPNKASLKRYLNDLKPVKNNIVPTPYSPSRINKTPKQKFGKTVQNGRNSQNYLPNKSLYMTYNFPENEYPLDNSPRDTFGIGMNYNDKYLVNNLQKCGRTLGELAINDLKREMKMKRKMLSNRQLNIENGQREIPTTKFTPSSDSMHLFDSETFPEVQYPLNTMETWGPNYWNYMSFSHEKPFNEFDQQIFGQKFKNVNNKPLTRLTKTTASKFLQPFDKLREEQRRTSTENSKRSNVGQKGLNFTKTATCESVSDDFITASLLSNIPSQSTETKKTLNTTDITPNSENSCTVTEYSYHIMPIPYRVIEKNSENICPAVDLKNHTEELQDVKNSVIAQTLQFIQEILLNDDASMETPPENFGTNIEHEINISDHANVPETENMPTISMDSVNTCTDTPTEELSLNYPDDTSIDIFKNIEPPHPTVITVEKDITTASPLSVRIPLSVTQPIAYGALTNSPNINPSILSNVNVIPGSTSIIIIPMNNNANGKAQSHIIESTSDTPIVLYIPTTQSSGISPQNVVPIQNDSSTGENPVPNNILYNDLSNMAPLQNDNPSSIALVSESLNDISDSGSSLPIYETLPTNSMCYNNENSPSSTTEKSFQQDDKPFVIPTCDLESVKNQSTESYSKADTLPPLTNFEHPLFDFAGSDLASLSHGPYNNILNEELPITAREINSNLQVPNVTSEDLCIETQNVTLECSQTNNSANSILKESLTESRDKTLQTPLIEAPRAGLSVPHTPIPISESVSDILPMMADAQLPPEITTNSEQDMTDMPLPTIFNSSINRTDHVTFNAALLPELYKVRQLIDKVLSSEIPIDNKPSLDTTLSSILDSDCLSLSINDTLQPNQTCPDNPPLLKENKELLLLSEIDCSNESLPIQEHKTHAPIPVDGISEDTLFTSVDTLLVPNIFVSSPLPSHNTVLLTPEPDTSTGNKLYLIDNLVTPTSETVPFLIKDMHNNALPHTKKDMPSKMDLTIPDIYEVSRDDLSISENDLPITMRQEDTNSQSILSTNDLPIRMVETSLPEVPFNDPQFPTDQLSLLEDEESVPSLPIFPALASLPPHLNSSNLDKLSEEVLTELILSDISNDNFLSPIDKTLPDATDIQTPIPINKIPSTSKLPIAKELLENVLSEIMKGELSSSVTKPRPHAPTPHSLLNKTLYYVNEKSSHSVSDEIKNSADNLQTSKKITDSLILYPIDSAMLINEMHTYKPEISTDDVEDVDIKSPLPNINDDSPPLPRTHLSDHSLVDNNLPLFGSSDDGIPLEIDQLLSEHSSSDTLKDKLEIRTDDVKDIDIKSPLPDINDDSPSLPSTELADLSTVDNNLPLFGSSDDGIPLDIVKSVPEHSSSDTLKDKPKIRTNDVKDIDIKSSLPDINDDSPSLPNTDKSVPEHSSSDTLKDKPKIRTDDVKDIDIKSSLPHINDDSPSLLNTDLASLLAVDNSLPFFGSSEDGIPLDIDKSLPENSGPDTFKEISSPMNQILSNSNGDLSSSLTKTISPSNGPSLNNKTPSSSTLPITKALLENVLSDINTRGFSLPEAKALPLSLPENSGSDTLKEISSPMNQILSNSNGDLSSSLTKTISPSNGPSLNNKTPSSSTLPITKALLENVLSDINTRGFSLPEGKALPLASRSQLDKTLYFLESPNPDFLTKNEPVIEINKDVSRTGELFSDSLNLDDPSDKSPSDKPFEENLEILNKMGEDKDLDKTPLSDISLDDTVNLLTQMEKQLPLTDLLDDVPTPGKNSYLASRIPITKALLQKVLTDITDGVLTAKDPITQLSENNQRTKRMFRNN